MATNNPETDSDIENKLSNEEKNFYNTVQPQTGYDRSIFMVGITGAGKSAFCNFLASEEIFEDGGGFSSVSQGGSYCRFKYNEEEVLIIDSPGFCDSSREDSEIYNELCKIGIVAKDGTDAVAIVVSSIERFSDNHRKALSMMEQMGGSFWEHAFIVFTNEREALRRNKVKTQEEYIQKVSNDPKCPPVLKEMLSKTENRYIFVDSISDFQNEDCRNDKCNQIFEFINQIRIKNNSVRYSNTLMLQGRKFFEEKEQSDKKVKELEEILKQKDIDMANEREHNKKEEERRIREADEARKQEQLRNEETERLKREQEKLKMEKMKDKNAKNAEKIEMLQKELHASQLREMQTKIDNLEREKDAEKGRRIENERESRNLQERLKVEQERIMEERARESRAVEYKQDVVKEAEKQSWGGWAKSLFL